MTSSSPPRVRRWLNVAPGPALYLLAVVVVFIATGTQTAWNILLGRIRISH